MATTTLSLKRSESTHFCSQKEPLRWLFSFVERFVQTIVVSARFPCGLGLYLDTVMRQLTLFAVLFVAILNGSTAHAQSSLSERARIAIARRLSQSTVSVVAGPSTGSGFVVQSGAQRLIITNVHVIEPNGMHFPIQIRYSGGTTIGATVVDIDRDHDLAILRVDGPRLTVRPLPLTDSDDVEVGQTVLAFGSPFGLDGSLTEGIVSARRDVPGLVHGSELIQTDAAINPGNSGGPLVDRRGRVVGVNTAIYSRTGGNHGVGFAVPANTVRDLIERARTQGLATAQAANTTSPQRSSAFLGVRGVDFAEGTLRGVRVESVLPGSPAQSAGLVGANEPAPPLVARAGIPWQGHIITAVDGHPIQTMAELVGAVSQHQPGEQIRISVTLGENRAGLSFSGDTMATLAAPPADGFAPPPAVPRAALPRAPHARLPH